MDSSRTLPWGAEILHTLGGAPRERAVALLIRHSVREQLTSWEEAPRVPLTPEGEAAARELGRSLPPWRPLQVWSSPVGRCQQTAQRLAEGFREAGGSADERGVMELLGVPYIRDFDGLRRLSERLGRDFPRAWFNGTLPESVVQQRDGAAADLLAGVAGELSQSTAPALLVFVTHDWNVLFTRESVLGLRHEDVGWPSYLDGLLVSLADGAAEVVWREHQSRVPVPQRAG